MTAGQILTFATTADWEAWRDTLTTSITASEAAAAMRLSPYCTARMLQLRKQAPHLAVFPSGSQLARGSAAERDLFAIYAGRTGAAVVPNGTTVYAHDCGWLFATPDAAVGTGGGLETKLDSVRGAAAAWPADGTEITDVRAQTYDATGETDPRRWIVRPDYWVQVQIQMLCTGWPWVDFLVQLIGFQEVEYRRVRIHAEPAEQAKILAYLTGWRARHLLADVIPPPMLDSDGQPIDDFDELERIAKWRYPERPKTREMTGEEQALALEYLALKADEARITTRKQQIRAFFVDAAADCKRLNGDGVRFRQDIKNKLTIEPVKEPAPREHWPRRTKQPLPNGQSEFVIIGGVNVPIDGSDFDPVEDGWESTHGQDR
jgi:hypothetical protein